MKYVGPVLVALFWLIIYGVPIGFALKMLFDIRRAVRRMAAALERQSPQPTGDAPEVPGNRT